MNIAVNLRRQAPGFDEQDFSPHSSVLLAADKNNNHLDGNISPTLSFFSNSASPCTISEGHGPGSSIYPTGEPMATTKRLILSGNMARTMESTKVGVGTWR